MKSVEVSGSAPDKWRERPLCRRYVAVVLNPLRLGTGGDGSDYCSAQWGLGVLGSGDHDIIGAWNACNGKAVKSDPIAMLRARGVQFIEWLVGTDLHHDLAQHRVSFPRVQTLDSMEQAFASTTEQVPARYRDRVATVLRLAVDSTGLKMSPLEITDAAKKDLGEICPRIVELLVAVLARSEPFLRLPESSQQLVRSADRAAAEVQGRLKRALHRHGPFVDSAKALDFVAEHLRRAERRLDVERASKAVVVPTASSPSPTVTPKLNAMGVPTLA